MRTKEWVQRMDTAARPLLLQVGANVHADTSYENADPGPLCARLGWASVLLEPIPHLFEQLRQRYADSPHIMPRRAAVCDSCAQREARMWLVDLTNASGRWGSNDSDPRCLGPKAAWLTEVASLSRKHVERHASTFYGAEYTRGMCAECAVQQGRPLPADCLRNVVLQNLREVSVPCFCLRDEVPQLGSVALLLLDAEGRDYSILQQYPFAAVPTARVIFEAAHMSSTQFHAAGALLRAHGFLWVEGRLGASMSVWHHVNSTEPFAWRLSRAGLVLEARNASGTLAGAST
mmetsp:Transcript_8826/g.19661  ORF Transcript_8826/g.19661 Transcript_8826/m.19661 type:complete len:290 (-) Transcript_8826:205-1074(-)